MKHILSLYILFTTLIPSAFSIGSNHPFPVDSATKTRINRWMASHGGLSFLENKGQMADMDGKPANTLLFKTSGNGVDMYVTTSGLSYVFTHKKTLKSKKPNSLGEAEDSITGQYCRADMELVGATIRKENIVKEDESQTYNNYYLGNCPDGILNVHSYQRITIKNIYPGIDWVLYTAAGAPENALNKAGLQYDFIVHPGADPSFIKLRYKWADKPQMQNNGSLKINIPLGNITEGKPVTYQESVYIHTSYTLNNNEVGFAMANYDKSKTLVIDPPLNWELNWSTYYGGSSTDVSNSIWSDGSHVWVTGGTESTNFPITNLVGAYNQGTLTGASENIFISCFNASTGASVWATYYGGTTAGETDIGKSISGDANNIWVFAQTTNQNTFPTANPGGYDWYQTRTTVTNTTGYHTGGAYPPGTLTGSPAPAILEFQKSTGARLYATFFSGISSGDYPDAVWDDGTHVWFSGSVTSTTFPVVYQTGYYNSPNTNYNAGFIIEFTTGGSLEWSTLFGQQTGGYPTCGSVCSDGANVWLTGTAYTGSIPVANPGGGAFYQGTDPTGDGCPYIAEFNIANIANGHQPVWCTFYGGNAASTESYGGGWTRTGYGNALYSDGTNVWLTGTTGSTNLPLANPGGGAYYQNTIGTGFHAFITEFSCTNEALDWGTYYAGNGTSSINGAEAESGRSINKDANGNVWVTGETESTNFPTLDLACSYNQSVLEGTQNAFVLEFNASGVRQWATYFGGNGTDEGNSIYGDGTSVWLTGGTTSTNFPLMTLGGAYNQAANGGGEDAFVSDFEPLQPLSVTMGPPTNVSCNGGNNGSATVNPVGGKIPYTYSWTPSGGSGATGTGLTAGSYTVTVTDNNGCTASSSVVITQPTGMLIAMGVSVGPSCNGGNNGYATVTANGGAVPYTYSWTPIGGANATGTGLSAGSYTITVTDNNACTATASTNITQPVPITGTVTSTGEPCYGYNDAMATVTPSGGTAPYNYSWNPGGQVSATAIGLSTGTYTVTITDANGCAGSATVTITQPPQTVVGFFSDVNQGCSPLCIQFHNTTAGVRLFYVWSFGDGDTSHAQNPIHCYSNGGVYTVMLTTYTDSGCSATLTKTNLIRVFTSPEAAFTYSPQPPTIFDPTIQFTSQSTDQYGIAQWLWTFGDQTDSVSYQQNPIHTYQDTGTYCTELKVTNIHGCTDSVTNCLIVEPVFTLYIPSAFTPNGDGLNDVFIAKGEYIKSFEMYIFDRWGMELFHSDNINFGWNGTVNGGSNICQEDTYVYKVLVTDYANNQHVYVGNVTLLK